MSSDRAGGGARTWAVPAAIVVVAALLITLVLTQGTGSTSAESEESASPAATADSPQQDLTDIERRDSKDLQAAGPVDAPVALVVYSDYQCPYCARWNSETLPAMRKYVRSGDLRIEWRDVNVYGPESERASRAAHAAARQGKYWEYHDALFRGGKHRRKSALSDKALTGLAKQTGLDLRKFARDMDSGSTRREVQRNAREGAELGVSSTPAFILGGEPILGAQPTDVFVKQLKKSLAAARSK